MRAACSSPAGAAWSNGPKTSGPCARTGWSSLWTARWKRWRWGGGRPLSSSPEALRAMEAERRPLYEKAADAVIRNDGTAEDAAARALQALNELFAQ